MNYFISFYLLLTPRDSISIHRQRGSWEGACGFQGDTLRKEKLKKGGRREVSMAVHDLHMSKHLLASEVSRVS